MKLIIVESPHKCQTISKFLPNDYKVVASVGHIRDLVSGRYWQDLGVDIKDNFKPTYVISKDKEKIVRELKDELLKADDVYLATDPDREGEAISWHLAQVLNLPVDTTNRIEFHEVTKTAVKKALANPRHIDMGLVESQETRRIIDRLMGFKLSNLLQNKIKSQSAGRVQSVVLRYIVDKEVEVKNFIPTEFWKIKAIFKDETGNVIEATLQSIDGKNITIHNEDEALNIIKELPKTFVVFDKVSTQIKKEAKPPFVTSTLQQEAFYKLHFSTKKTTQLMQRLYEGIEIQGEETGLITYIRTDSIRLSDEFISSCQSKIISQYGENYIGSIKTQKSKQTVQDAHEAIRPTDLSLTPESIKEYLSDDLYKLYSLIYKRAMASLMSAKIDEQTTLTLKAGRYAFVSTQIKTIFDGYYKVYSYSETNEEEKEDKSTSFSSIKENDEVNLIETSKEQKFTKGPTRYNEGTLVKLMEDKGIGRPSTYSTTVNTLIDREYVTKEKGFLVPTSQGELTAGSLEQFFPKYMDASYTAEMEDSLDAIADGKTDKVKLLSDFWNEFINLYNQAKEKMEKVKPVVVEGKLCPNCGSALVIRKGKFGDFVGCSNYPQCKYIEKEEKEEPEILPDKKCPLCGGNLIIRSSKKGKFIGCMNYPNCTYMTDLDGKQIDRTKKVKKEIVIPKDAKLCPSCHKGYLIEKVSSKTGKTFIGCSAFPKCRYIQKQKKDDDDE